MKTTICLFFTLLLTLSGGESYFDESYQKTVNREVLEREIADSLLKASSALPAAEAFVQETVKADYLFADALEKRLELMKRLIRYIRTEQNRKQQPEGILYASHGARELIQFLEYFQLEKERFAVSKQKPLLFSVDRFGAKGDGISDNTQAFQRALDEIRKRNGVPAILKIPRGKYRFRTLNPRGLPVNTVMMHQSTCYPTTFRPSHLLIRNLKNLTIEGEAETELLFDHSTYVDGIALWGCDNVTVRNLILDFTNTPFTQGTILKSDFGKNEVILQVDEGHLPLIGPSHFKNFLKGTMLYSADGKQLIHQAGIFHPSGIKALGGRRYLYRLTGPFDNPDYTAWEFAAADGSEALVTCVVNHHYPSEPTRFLRLAGLIPAARYREHSTGAVFSGSTLMRAGWQLPRVSRDGESRQFHFELVR